MIKKRFKDFEIFRRRLRRIRTFTVKDIFSLFPAPSRGVRYVNNSIYFATVAYPIAKENQFSE